MKCLIADDSYIIRALLSRIMTGLNFDVIEAEDGEEVLELCQLQEPELVITDINMPILDGFGVLSQIRENDKVKQPKIIFCSSSVDATRIKQALDGGADEYIMKPFDEDIIISKLAILGLR